jgi:drug/metabolite transporter (DMT)-like permease
VRIFLGIFDLRLDRNSIQEVAGVRIVILTLIALIAFAANSIICRMALGNSVIDPASFSTIRLASGALVLFFMVRMHGKKSPIRYTGTWISAGMLFLYAVSFSFAYVSLSVGTGALISFGAVQATMICAGLLKGERLHVLAWIGLLVALSGLAYLVFPSLDSPPLTGTVLMVTAGVSWGIYSLRGFNTCHPIALTSDNFLRSLPFAFIVSLVMLPDMNVTAKGLVWAVISGAITSGVGYVVWYAALQGLSTTRAATVQLFVPIIAALGGVLFLSEQITLRLILAAILIIGGVGLTLTYRRR